MVAANTIPYEPYEDKNAKITENLVSALTPAIAQAIGSAISPQIQSLTVDFTNMDNRVSKLETNITLDSHEQNQIQREVSHQIRRLLKDESPRKFAKYSHTFYSRLYSDLRNRFCVGSYKDIRKIDLDDAKDFIREWEPIGGVQHLKDVIEDRGNDNAPD